MADRIILIRHGETAWSLSRQHTSFTDLELTENGRLAASRLAVHLAQYEIATVLSSPRRRAFDTALLAFGTERGIETADALQEWNYGKYEGLTTAEIHKTNPSWDLWTDGGPDGESPIQVTERVDGILSRASAMTGTVALVAHGHILRSIAVRYLKLDISYGGAFTLDTSSVSVLGFEHERPSMQSWNVQL